MSVKNPEFEAKINRGRDGKFADKNNPTAPTVSQTAADPYQDFVDTPAADYEQLGILSEAVGDRENQVQHVKADLPNGEQLDGYATRPGMVDPKKLPTGWKLRRNLSLNGSQVDVLSVNENMPHNATRLKLKADGRTLREDRQQFEAALDEMISDEDIRLYAHE